MDDPLLVRGGQPARDLPGDVDRTANRQRARGVARAASCLRAARRRDTARPRACRRRGARGCWGGRGRQRRGPPARSGAGDRRSARAPSAQDLDRDVAPEARVARAVHLAHAACAQGARGSRTGPSLVPGVSMCHSPWLRRDLAVARQRKVRAEAGPPAPSAPRISYGPSRAPVVSVIRHLHLSMGPRQGERQSRRVQAWF